jgi:hypothetical protein
MRPYALSVALVLLGLATPATAAALAPSKPSQLVAVVATGSCPFVGVTTGLFDTLVKGDGTRAPFSIPAGEVLVITDLTILANAETPGHTIQAQLLAGTSAISNFDIFAENVTAGTSGGVTLAATFPTGIVVKSGTSLCPVAIDFTSSGGSVSAGGTLHGFLTKDK